MIHGPYNVKFKIVVHVKFNLHTLRIGGGQLLFPQGIRRVSVVPDNFPEEEHTGFKIFLYQLSAFTSNIRN